MVNDHLIILIIRNMLVICQFELFIFPTEASLFVLSFPSVLQWVGTHCILVAVN